MDTRTLIILGVLFVLGVLGAIAVAIWFYAKTKRTSSLRDKFGAEYNRAVRAEGGTGAAEQVLQERQQRVAKLDIKPLSDEQRIEFADAWEHAQARFVDDPEAAVANADVLVQQVMSVRGYPVTDFEQRVADVSVDHPAVVQNYRIAHQIAEHQGIEDVGIDKLREAMLHYRSLFADLLHDGGVKPIRQVVRDDREIAPERLRRAG
jgi:Na+-transporting methylmalonyl-CoA/oxaloacetate decarboxylase gamma subunit